MLPRCTIAAIAAIAALAVACSTDEASVVRGVEPAVTAPAASLRLLTVAQYHNAVHDLFDGRAFVPGQLNADIESGGLLTAGASVASVSPLGVERYEAAALSIGAQVAADDALRDLVVPCAPSAVDDATCARAALGPLARRAWRGSPPDDALDRVVDVAVGAGAVLGDFYQGVGFGVAAILQSPLFLYRDESSQRQPPGALTPTEPGSISGEQLAAKLSFFLWNTLPDDALLAAAAAGRLDSASGVADVVDEMMVDQRFRAGLRAFFDDAWALYELEHLVKDPTVYPSMSAELGPAAREETLLGVEWLVLAENGDFRDLVTTQRTFVDRRLAALYGVPAPSLDGFGQVVLPLSAGRVGLLGQASFLAGASHVTSTSVTLRGIHVRERLLCQTIPAPPADVDTSIPAPSADARTMRDRVAVHLENLSCANCHALTDPIGLALEPFDGIGQFRSTEDGYAIDASGALDGVPFDNARGLAVALREHPDLAPCLAETLVRYAHGRELDVGEAAYAAWVTEGFAESGYRVRALMRDVAISAAFRAAGAGQ